MDGQIFFKTAIVFYIMFICALLLWNSKSYVSQNDKKSIDSGGSKQKVTVQTNTRFEVVNVTEMLNRKPLNIQEYLPRYVGPGADGKQSRIPDDDDKYDVVRAKYLKYQVNNLLSKMVGIKRVQPDRRPDGCKKIVYPFDLEPVSIILTFRDEPAVTLLRTVYSILETTPAYLIKEIILIDDGSEQQELLSTVKVHVANVEKLKVLRNEKSVGLMKARQRGILAAEADYFIVLDGHVEVTPGWLEPVLYRLREQPKSLLTSHIGVINCENFAFYSGNFEEWFLTFDQISLNEHWVHYSDKYLKSRNGSVDPIPYGIVPGNMMAMKTSFFLQLGGFDQGMEIWGAEHLEMSVKVWLCGGRVEMLPCSIVGHVYRPAPWFKFHPNNDYVTKNLLRFALVWMDGYILDTVMQIRRSDNLTKLLETVGDVSERKQIRIDNKCHPYQHFTDQLRSISDTYIPVKPKQKGTLKNVARGMCIDRAMLSGKYSLIIYHCSGNINQYIVFTEFSGLVIDRVWLTVLRGTDELALIMEENNWLSNDFKWVYENDGMFKHLVTGKCLTASTSDPVTLQNCTNGSPYQQWEWTSMN